MATLPDDSGGIKEARKILGDEAKDLSDEEVRQIVRTLNLLASELLDMQERGEL